MNKHKLAELPQIEQLLQDLKIQHCFENLGRPIVAEIARSAVESIRNSVLKGETDVPPLDEITGRIISSCKLEEKNRLKKVINATGIIIHTNMGRAPLSREVWKDAGEVNCRYSNLELDLQTGKRGKRKGMIPRLVKELTGAEDALIVNNNAAAVFLILKSFASGREVIVSRGEQVQIGGGFRIPEILSQSGAHLVETGTTNICTVDDYLSAFSQQTSMILSVHRSNFAIRGFTSSPSIRELAGIKPENVLLCVDQGSGVIDETLPGEISVCSHLKEGADLVCFSGDKILGGPQAGIIAGRKELIDVLEHHPLMRILRPGKTVYSLLESTLIRRLNRINTVVSESLAADTKELRRRGRKILQGISRDKAFIVDSTFTTGGGSSPDESFPSLSICINSNENPEKILGVLRDASVPIIGTISDNKVHLNLASIQPEDLSCIRLELQKVLGG